VRETKRSCKKALWCQSCVSPGDVDYAFTNIGDLSKGSQREINGITISARGASIGDGDNNGLVVRGVGNFDFFTTKAGSQAKVSVTISVNSCDQIVVAMNSAACTRVAILIKVCGVATGIDLTEVGM